MITRLGNFGKGIWLLCGVVMLGAGAIAPHRLAADEPAAMMAPVPDAAAQDKAARTVKNLFKDEIDAAKTPAAKIELAKSLLQRGIDTQDDPPGQYALLRVARDYAVAQAEAALAMQAVDEIAHSFEIDALAAKLETLTSVSKATMNPPQSKAFAETANSVVDDAIFADNYEIAKQALALAQAAAKKTRDGELNKLMASRGKEIESLEASFQSVKAAQAQLDESPLDPSANFAVGRYRALVKGDWDRGLPMLALSNDPKLKVLAVMELEPSPTAETQYKLAEAWVDYAAALDGSAKERTESRGLFWYARVLPQLTGLQKLQVEKVLQDAAGKMYAKIQAALRAKKVALSKVAGSNRGVYFADALDEGGMLVGLEIGTIEVNGQEFVSAVKPLYRAARGDVSGTAHGIGSRTTVPIKAREGFAVGGIAVKAGAHVEAISITFMQTEGMGLNPRNSYNSQWVGGDSGAQEFHLGGSGTPVVGIAGRIAPVTKTMSVLEGIQLISLR
jgi:hypothetical protein